jgi:hypothetical protein
MNPVRMTARRECLASIRRICIWFLSRLKAGCRPETRYASGPQRGPFGDKTQGVGGELRAVTAKLAMAVC